MLEGEEGFEEVKVSHIAMSGREGEGEGEAAREYPGIMLGSERWEVLGMTREQVRWKYCMHVRV